VYTVLKRLCAEGIIVLQNIDSASLHMTARLTGAVILPTCAHLGLASVTQDVSPVGVAKSFRIIRIDDDPEVQSVSLV
jgi:hypothetical protein